MRNLIIMIFLLSFCGILNAQNVTIKGNVKSAAGGEPLIGVNVSVKGKAVGTVTDIDGNYQLSVQKNETLTFSFIGYDKQEVVVGAQTIINVALKESSLLLDEVVAVGYRTERKADLTGAVSVVKVNDMMSAAENNPMKALQDALQQNEKKN